jgi:hypothetical protein
MIDPIEECMKIWKDSIATDKENPTDRITFREYLTNLKSLTFMDLFLGVLLCGLIMGVAFQLYSTELIQVSFLGIVLFLTLKMTHKKLTADFCMSCQGLNMMSYTTKFNVILSFCWSIVQTFVALLLNVIHYFIILFMIYILLRSHLIYDFAPIVYRDGQRIELPDMRILSTLHKAMRFPPMHAMTNNMILFLFRPIYWIILLVATSSVIGYISMMITRPNDLKKFTKKFTGRKLSGLFMLFVPFLSIAVTLTMRFMYGRLNLSWVDEFIARRVTPAFSFTTVTSAFEFLKGSILHTHAIVFLVAIVCAIVYSIFALSPLSKSMLCKNKELNPEEKNAIDSFKNRFLLGHYIIGLLIIIAYILKFGGDTGKSTIAGVLVFTFIIYLCVILSTPKEDGDDEDEQVV